MRATGGGQLRRASRAFAAALGTIGLLLAGNQPTAHPDVEAARAELRGLIQDVTTATAFRYRTTDDLGRWMDTAKIIWIPEADRFAAVYHTWSVPDQRFDVQLATSADLMQWTWQATLAERAAQAAIAPAPDNGYVVAWEQGPDPIHVAVSSFTDWNALLAGSADRHFDAPPSMAGCAEGTPSIERVTRREVKLGFHFYSGCTHDRQAGGSTDWSGWQAISRPRIDSALIAAGARGHIGDRDAIDLGGHRLELIEAQLRLGDPGSWRTYLYDAETGRASLIPFRSHARSQSFANPTVGHVRIGGRDAILVTLYLFSEGAGGNESGELVYYRTLESVRSALR